MAQELKLKLRGLATHPNPFSEAAEGSLAVADEVVMVRESILESRRGFKQYGDALTSIQKYFNFQDKLIVHDGTTLKFDSDDAGTWSSYSGTYNPPSGRKISSAEMNKNFYFTTTEGIKKLASVTGTIGESGTPRALDGSGSVTGSSGFLADQANVAYRVVWGIKDDNDNLILGAPSERIVVGNNAGATRDVSLTFTIPEDITTDYFFQVYRSAQTSVLATEPDDELQLVYEENPTSGEITAKLITFTDSTPDSLKGASLYTNESQEGILEGNLQPPFAKDLVAFRNHMFYLNTKTLHRRFLTMISAGFTATTDTITIAGTTYTAETAEDASAGEFEIFTGGTPAENIEDTAKSLVRVINRYATNTTVYAYYVSGFAELPGQILIENRDINGSQFSVTASSTSVGDKFDPELPTSGTSVSSSNEENVNRVYISKLSQPEGVPLLSFLDVGNARDEIIRGLPLTDGIVIFKEDGVWKITGTDRGNFEVNIIDPTVIIKGAETAQVVDNNAYCMSDQGVVAANLNGVAIVSRAIDKDILFLLPFSSFDTLAYGTSYNSESLYILGVQTASTDTTVTQLLVYNTKTRDWTRWVKSYVHGIVSKRDDKLYFGQTDNTTRQERKDRSSTDFADDEFAVTIDSIADPVLTLASVTNVSVGMTIKQGANAQSKITGISGLDVTVEDALLPWTTGAATVYTAINQKVEWNLIAGGNPGIYKQWYDIVYIFLNAGFSAITQKAKSHFSQGFTSTTIQANLTAQWGNFGFGDEVWGGTFGGSQPLHTYLPRDSQIAHWIQLRLELSQAFTSITLGGVHLKFDFLDGRTN